MATVTVRGVGGATSVPIGVELQLTISVLDEAPDRALEHAASLDEELRGVLDRLGVPAADRTTTAATVRQELAYDQRTEQQVVRGFRAEIATRVRLDDPATAGPLLKDATTRAQAQVAGPWWRISPDDPARLEACAAAAVDARARAEAYAEAVGSRLGPLVSLTEAVGAMVPFTRPFTGYAAVAAVSEVAFSPGELQVNATVEATFELLGA
jgi:hypothetical protein